MSRDYVLQPFRPAVHLQIDYSRELNEQQLAAVTAPPGPALVIAGAGSGKTKTLTFRVAFLLEQGIPAERILLLTFTNKAAGEMMRRLSNLLGQEMNDLWGGTFHSIGNRMLRKHADRLGFQRDFTILDREDARHLIGTCIAEMQIDIKKTRFPKPDLLADVFSLASNTQKPVVDILVEQFGEYEQLKDEVLQVQARYAARKLSTNAMDFDDLLVLWLKLLRDHGDLRELYQRRFNFVLVDEYQDTNRLQSDLVYLLAERNKNVMAVGDDAQSIYAWRGANFQNILKFPEIFPNTVIYKIETNYRSTPEILAVANAAISSNTRQFRKQLTPARPSGIKPVLVPCEDASQQATFLAQRVLELREEGTGLDKMAILYRSHFHALELQLELTRRNIPFSITSGIRFFEQAHIKDATAYLKLATNPRDELSFKRLVQLLPGIGGRGAEKLWATFQASVVPVAGDDPPSPIARALQVCAGGIPKKAAVSWAQLVATMAQLEGKDIKGNPARMLQLILDAGYVDHLKANYANYESRLDDIENLSVFARQYKTTEDFLSELALLSNIEAEAEQPANKDEELLRLSTIHQAKGLEFEIVFVIMLCDGLFPSTRSMGVPDGEEEERRLFYVAITRARSELYFAYPLVRAMPGAADFMQRPSRFLGEIPRELIDEWNLRPYG